MNRWRFDVNFFIKTIDTATENLNDPKISGMTKLLLQETICEASSALDILINNSYYSNKNFTKETEFSKVKDLFIDKAIYDYKTIDEKLRDLIIFLSDNMTILEYKSNNYFGKDNPDDIVALSLNIYDNMLPIFSKIARTIIDYPINLINFDLNSNIGSQCFFVFNLPFLHIENYCKQPDNFIHELQHGVEKMLEYKTPIYYKELGPILLETLYIDALVNKNYSNASSLYFERIAEVEAFLDYLSRYFKCLRELKKYNFNVQMNKFIDIINSNNLLYGNKFTMNDLLNEDFKEYLMYLLSFFKSLTIRDIIYQDKKKGLEMLVNSLKSCKEEIYKMNTNNTLQSYDDYLKEIVLKEKKLSYIKR